MSDKPITYESVLAKIKQVNDLGVSHWSEVVCWNGTEWISYGCKFEKNASVESWIYVSEIADLRAKLEAAEKKLEEDVKVKCDMHDSWFDECAKQRERAEAAESQCDELKARCEKAEGDLLKAKGHFSYCCTPSLEELEKLDKDSDMVCCRCGEKGDFPFHPSDDGYGTDGQYCPKCGHSGLEIVPVWECLECRKEKLKAAGGE